MWKKIKHWWAWHGFTIMSHKTLFSKMVALQIALSEVDNKCAWAAINPVIASLNELEKNTWDVERVRKIKKWLINNFEFQNCHTRKTS